MSTAYEQFLSVLEEHGCRKGREFCCPSHADRHPSLSISEGDDGRVLVKCHAGCEPKEIVAALGLNLSDLFEANGKSAEQRSFKIIDQYEYTDENGVLLFQVCRLNPKSFRQRRPDGNGGWIWNLNGVQRVPFRLPSVLETARAGGIIYVVEGEKDVLAIEKAGGIATCNPGGVGKWRPDYSKSLAGAHCRIIADGDGPGVRHARDIAESLRPYAASVILLKTAEGKDASDHLAAGFGLDDFEPLGDEVVENSADENNESDSIDESDTGDESGTGKQESQASRLVNMVIERGVELFHDEVGDTFAHVPIGDHREVWPCECTTFKHWMTRLFWESEGKVLSTEALRGALNILQAKARFEGKEYKLHNRVARYDGAIWYDLADRGWRAVKVTARGWEIVEQPPILFRRYAHQQPQPEPVRGGDLHRLLDFLNIGGWGQCLLLLVYVVTACVPEIPHPIPILYGQQGSAKTTLLRMLRKIIDPSVTAVLSFPRDAVELVQQLSHHWAPFYDNVTNLSGSTSDMLCRAVTGEGYSKRQLYSNDDDVIYLFRRCVALNGINVAVHKPDLLDRCILIGLEKIEKSARKPEKKIWEEFEKARPQLLGAVFDLLSQAMAYRDSIHLPELPRMADFALWGCAVTRALGYSQEDFLTAYDLNASTRNEEALQASPVGTMVMELMDGRLEWEGTLSELLTKLEELAESKCVDTKCRSWPKAAHVLRSRLNEVLPNLAEIGIEVTFHRVEHGRMVTIQRVTGNSVRSVRSVRTVDRAQDTAVGG